MRTFRVMLRGWPQLYSEVQEWIVCNNVAVTSQELSVGNRIILDLPEEERARVIAALECYEFDHLERGLVGQEGGQALPFNGPASAFEIINLCRLEPLSAPPVLLGALFTEEVSPQVQGHFADRQREEEEFAALAEPVDETFLRIDKTIRRQFLSLKNWSELLSKKISKERSANSAEFGMLIREILQEQGVALPG